MDDAWNEGLLENMISRDMTENTLFYISVGKVGSDILIWKPSTNNSFAIVSAWELIRMKSEVMNGSTQFWNPDLPKKICICMWKEKYGYLTIDNIIQNRGINLISKCDCCSKPKIETIDHVLCTGEFA